MRHWERLGRQLAKICAILLIVTTVGADLAARSARAADFPVYVRARIHWHMSNIRHVSNIRFDDKGTFDAALLAGDGVVYRGLPFDHNELIGRLAESPDEDQIWVAAAGGSCLVLGGGFAAFLWLVPTFKRWLTEHDNALSKLSKEERVERDKDDAW